jgi:hypothetical protein
LEGAKKIEDAMKAREAAKDAARLKDMTAAQRQWELESRILRAINEEKTALAKQDEARAAKAQAAQEDALKKLIQDPITPDYVVKKYADMVKAIESEPSIKIKMTIDKEKLIQEFSEMDPQPIKLKMDLVNMTEMPEKLQAVLLSKSGGYQVIFADAAINVVPSLVWPGETEGGTKGQFPVMENSATPLADLIRNADKTGANP